MQSIIALNQFSPEKVYFILLSAGTFSVVQVDLKLDRKIGYYVLQIIIPSMLLVILSWVSFWVDANAVAPRVSLGVTCVLTMTTQTSGIRMTLPPVSYVKAIDVWMFVCLLFVFAALVEYAYVNTVTRRQKKKNKSTNIEQSEQPEVNTFIIPFTVELQWLEY